MGTALVGFGVPQPARADSISKRVPSTPQSDSLSASSLPLRRSSQRSCTSRLVARSAVRTLRSARLARGLPLGRDDPPRLAQVTLERVIRDLIEQDADPPAGADIPRVKIGVG